jgi:hypothetical protein
MTAQLTSIRPRLSAYRIIRLFAGPVTAYRLTLAGRG